MNEAAGRATRPVSVTTKLFPSHPATSSKSGRVFGLRTYTTSPFIDGTSYYAFTRLFHEKEVLIPVLNDAFQLEGDQEVKDVSFEEDPRGIPERYRHKFDLSCKTNAGELIIVAMQRMPQLIFYRRDLWDWTHEVTQQDKPHSEIDVAHRDSKKVAWDHNFKQVYEFNICDFPVFADDLKLSAAPLLRGYFNGNVLNYREPFRLCLMQLPNCTIERGINSRSPAEKVGTILAHLHKLGSVEELPRSLRDDPLVDRAVQLLSLEKLSREEAYHYRYCLRHERDDWAIQMNLEDIERRIEEANRECEEINHARK